MSFKDVIVAIKQVSSCYKNGLQALGNNSAKIKPLRSRNCEGSLNIDSCLREVESDAPRWDYIIGYNSKVYCIEVHPASGGEVKSVINKVNWIKNWLNTIGISIKIYNRKHPTYHWIASGKVTILRNSTYARKLSEASVEFPKELMRIS